MTQTIMWSSRQQTPTLSTPTSGFSSPRPWSLRSEGSCVQGGELRHRAQGMEYHATEGMAAVGSLVGAPAGCVLDGTTTNAKIDEVLKHQHSQQQELEERHQYKKKYEECHQQQRQVQAAAEHPPVARNSKRLAVLGTVRRLFSRPRTASRSRAASVEPECMRSASWSGDEVGIARCKPTPASRRLFHVDIHDDPQPRRSASCVIIGPRGTAPTLMKPRPDRIENFHRALENKLVSQAFEQFCERTLSSENVEFVRQVRELDHLLAIDGTSTSELRGRLRHVADNFLAPDSETEVNVKGSSREDVLCSITSALEAGKNGSRGGGDSPWARVLAVAATEAVVHLARDVYYLIFDGIWPRFLTSDEFNLMMSSVEMRTAGFTDIDGKIIVSALPPQHPPARMERRKEFSAGFTWRLGRDAPAPRPKPESALPPAAPLAPPAPPAPAPAPPAVSQGISTRSSSMDVVEAAKAAAEAAAQTRPPLARRHPCRSVFRAAGANAVRERALGFGDAFSSVPGVGRKDVVSPDARAPMSAMSLRGIRYSSSRRAVSLR